MSCSPESINTCSLLLFSLVTLSSLSDVRVELTSPARKSRCFTLKLTRLCVCVFLCFCDRSLFHFFCFYHIVSGMSVYNSFSSCSLARAPEMWSHHFSRCVQMQTSTLGEGFPNSFHPNRDPSRLWIDAWR